MAGPRADRYASRFLVEQAATDAGARLLRCRVCGAYWEMHVDDAATGEAGVRTHLSRLDDPDVIEDWRTYESEDRD